MSLVAVLQGRPPDGRGNTGFYEIVRLGEADKKSIADRGYTVVDLNDATAEPAVFAFILFCRDAVEYMACRAAPRGGYPDAQRLPRRRRCRSFGTVSFALGFGWLTAPRRLRKRRSKSK